MIDGPTVGELIGARVRELRQEAGLSQRALAELAVMHRPNVVRLEQGTACSPTLEVLLRVARALNTPVVNIVCVLDGFDALDIETDEEE